MNRMFQINSHSYVYIWKFKVTWDKEAVFQKKYGSEGEWAQLFRQGEGYQQTFLLKDLDEPGTYITVDMWESEAAYTAFKEVFKAAYETLDKQCENLTVSEELVGHYENL